jgi:hypothetical protein
LSGRREDDEARFVMFGFLGFLAISYLVVVGFVLMVLAAMQEAARNRPELETRWDIAAWSRARFAATAALLALPSLLLLIPIGLLFVA